MHAGDTTAAMPHSLDRVFIKAGLLSLGWRWIFRPRIYPPTVLGLVCSLPLSALIAVGGTVVVGEVECECWSSFRAGVSSLGSSRTEVALPASEMCVCWSGTKMRDIGDLR